MKKEKYNNIIMRKIKITLAACNEEQEQEPGSMSDLSLIN